MLLTAKARSLDGLAMGRMVNTDFQGQAAI